MKLIYGPSVGSSEQEIFEFEDWHDHVFLATCHGQLLWMENHKRGIFRGSEWSLTDVVRNTEALPDLLAEHDLSLDETTQLVCFIKGA